MRCASLVVGVADYVSPHYRHSMMRLRFAASDALAFSTYASLAWPSSDVPARHQLLTDRFASLASLEAATEAIAAHGPYDLLLVYLSGHGEMGGETHGWFCLADATPNVPSLDGTLLEGLLARIPAENVLLLIDCCHAEGITSGLRFFADLQGQRSRVFAASARAHQKSWEEDALERSIFSDVLLRALSTGSPLADATGYVDVEARLLPYLRDQTMLLASTTKQGQEQEPVTGGLAASPLKLPTVTSRSLGRQLSIAETVRSRLRRVAAVVGLSLLVSLLLADLLLFHIAVGPAGDIVIRPGLAGTYAILPFHFGAEIDSGFSLTDLDQRNTALFSRLKAGDLRGFATHRSKAGIRVWLPALEPGLIASARSSVQILVAGQSATFSEDDRPPLEELLFLSQLTPRPVWDVASDLYSAPFADVLSCSQDPDRTFDFNNLDPSTAVVIPDLEWLAVTAPADERTRAEVLLRLVRLTAYRAAHKQAADCDCDYDAAAELRALGRALSMWTPDSESRDLYPITANHLRDMSGTWCSLPAAIAISLIGTDADREAAETRLRSVLDDSAERQAGALDASKTEAAEALGVIVAERPLSERTITTVAQLIEREESGLLATTPATTLLRRVASRQRLPDSIRDRLLEVLRRSDDDSEPDRIAAFEVLARNARRQEEPVRRELRAWAAAHSDTHRTISIFHEALGFLALADGRASDVSLLEARLSPATLFPPRATTRRGVTIISSTGDSAAVALARIGQKNRLDSGLVARLRRFAISRTDVPERDEIVRALTNQEQLEPAAVSFHALLGRDRSDADSRQLNVEIAIERLSQVSRSDREHAMRDLLRLWQIETEPEIRIALGRVLGSRRLK